MALSDATSRSGGQTKNYRHERLRSGSDCDVAKTLIRTIVRIIGHRDAGPRAMVFLERIAVDHVLGEFQFTFHNHTEHCLLCE